MVKTRLHIGWLWSSIILMVLTACSSSDDKAGQQPTMLTIYVYSPEHPMLTRSDVGPVNATEAENKVTSLQIWVYDGVGNRVGYLNTKETATLNAGEGAVYQIPVPDDFAKNKPNLDVYVMANVTSETCGITPADFTEWSAYVGCVAWCDGHGLGSCFQDFYREVDSCCVKVAFCLCQYSRNLC